MSERHSDEWLTEAEILAKTGIGPSMFVRYRKFFKTADRSFHGRGGGSDPYDYAHDTIDVIDWLRAHKNETRGDNDRAWGLWFADRYEIVNWIDDRLARLQKRVAGHGAEDIKKPIAHFVRTPAKRTDPHRTIFRHLQEQSGRKSLFEWAAATGMNVTPAIGLYEPSSPVEPAFKKGVGANCPPDPELDIENMSIERLRKILGDATPAQLAQVRLDCMTLANMVQIARSIDWRSAGMYLSLTPRAAEGARVSPLAPFERLSTLWHKFDFRAAVIPFLIHVRGLPDYSGDYIENRFAERSEELEALARQFPKSR